ncbi:ATP-dependent protease [Clostridiales bacterium PH28_bin88]|nr:ATP-dependent protease [Clostridiales bacterium PH28_bin88]
MPLPYELTSEQLRRTCDPETFPFETTAELEPFQGIIGQQRAAQAMEFGLKVQRPGYNIYIAGAIGSGRVSYARSAVRQMASTEPVPDDWCYVFNFQKPSQPKALSLPAGMGSVFRQDMEELVEDLRMEIPKAFEGDDYDKQKNELFKEFQEKSGLYLEQLNQIATEQGFTLKRTSTGFATIPMVDGKAISPEEYEQLEAEIKEELERRSNEIQLKGMEIIRRIQQAEKATKEKIKELENRIALFAVGPLIDDLGEKYGDFPQVIEYLEDVKDDVLSNLSTFRGEEEEQTTLPWVRRMRENALMKYQVNLLIDNRENQGAPVVVEPNPTYYNLVGRIEHENEWGVLVTDFTMIKPGALHKANGGYLIIHAKDVLNNPGSWEALKRVLKTREVRIENMGEHYGLIAMATSKPEPIPVNVKVVLIGSLFLYHLLHQYDEDFKKLFKIKADFDTDMIRDADNTYELAGFISALCRREGLRHFHRRAVARVVEYSSRLAEDQRRLTTCFNEIVELLYEADAWAASEGSEIVDHCHVAKAFTEKRLRSNLYEEKLHELMAEGTILLDTAGEVVGQVNGLSVLTVGDYTFGRPTRITAATFLGERGVAHIERETKMSGNIHSKGVLIISGYLGAKYAQETPLALSASLCFEQLYEGIDGDSASSAELYALLSSLSGLPIKQGIAVTGSVNQKGEIQPVGGVTAKVEGFFHLCKNRGLTGEQGVIIPRQNVVNLNLSEELIEAVAKGKFHLYAVGTVDEGIEILTGVPAGVRRKNGTYPKGSVHYRVIKTLKKYVSRMTAFSGERDHERSKAEVTDKRP